MTVLWLTVTMMALWEKAIAEQPSGYYIVDDPSSIHSDSESHMYSPSTSGVQYIPGSLGHQQYSVIYQRVGPAPDGSQQQLLQQQQQPSYMYSSAGSLFALGDNDAVSSGSSPLLHLFSSSSSSSASSSSAADGSANHGRPFSAGPSSIGGQVLGPRLTGSSFSLTGGQVTYPGSEASAGRLAGSSSAGYARRTMDSDFEPVDLSGVRGQSTPEDEGRRKKSRKHDDSENDEAESGSEEDDYGDERGAGNGHGRGKSRRRDEDDSDEHKSGKESYFKPPKKMKPKVIIVKKITPLSTSTFLG